MNSQTQVKGTPATPQPKPLISDEPNSTPIHAFWQQAWAQNVLPFVSSIAVHAGIIVIGLIVLASIPAVRQAARTLEQQIAPSTTDVDTFTPGGVQFVGLDNDPTRRAEQPNDETAVDASGWAREAGPSQKPELAGGGDGDGATDPLIGIGSAGKFGQGTGIGVGKGNKNGSGNDEGGPIAPFGTPGGGQMGPKSHFVGCYGNARRVAYLCDATGTMLNVFGDLKIELQKSITGLTPAQGFNIFFFQNESFSPLSTKGLLLATPVNKRKAFNFLDESNAQGTTNPIPAIRAAFADKPQLIYVLTDGFDAVGSYDEVVNEFRRLNANKAVKVNTIMVKSSNEPELEAVLKKIATENGGQFRLVTPEEMGN